MIFTFQFLVVGRLPMTSGYVTTLIVGSTPSTYSAQIGCTSRCYTVSA